MQFRFFWKTDLYEEPGRERRVRLGLEQRVIA